MDASDSDCYERAQRGDAKALGLLLERYLPQLHAFVRLRLGAAVRARESSMDVVQSVCRQLLAAQERFEFRGEDRFRAWLFTAALHKLLDKQRQHQPARAPAPESDVHLQHAAHLLTPSLDAIGAETAAALQQALAALSEEHREVVTLARIVKLPHRVIAEVMGRSEEATRQLLARAMARLAEELRSRGVETP